MNSDHVTAGVTVLGAMTALSVVLGPEGLGLTANVAQAVSVLVVFLIGSAAGVVQWWTANAGKSNTPAKTGGLTISKDGTIGPA